MSRMGFEQYWADVIARPIRDDVWLINPHESYHEEAAAILVLPGAAQANSNASQPMSSQELKALFEAHELLDIKDRFVASIQDDPPPSLVADNQFIYTASHPWKVGFELTSACNFRCKHCYASSLKAAIPSTEEVLLLIDEMAKAGVLWIWFTGGECTTRPDFPELYKHAKQAGFIVSFLTNATLITDELLVTLAAYPPYVVKVSLYGASGHTYEAMTGKAENYSRARLGIEKLRAQGTNVTVQCVLTELNESDISAMVEFCESLGVTYNLASRMIPRLDGDPSPTALRSSALHLTTSYLDEYAKFFCDTMHIAGQHRENARLQNMFFCGAGLCFCFISSDLYLLPCLLGREHGKELKKFSYSFAHAFESIAQARPSFLSVALECRACSSIPYCHLCLFRRALYRNIPDEIARSCAEV